jgi:hypothetical protein
MGITTIKLSHQAVAAISGPAFNRWPTTAFRRGSDAAEDCRSTPEGGEPCRTGEGRIKNAFAGGRRRGPL